jgi:hypothetical protein
MNINHTEESVTTHEPRYKLYLLRILSYIDDYFGIIILFLSMIVAD